MFKNGDGGYFCCHPGELGMIPSKGKGGGLCQPADQTLPKSLLATVVSQFGIAAATPAPSGGVGGATNATATSNGNPSETNPTSSTTTSVDPTTGGTNVVSNINHWPLATKIGVGVGVLVILVLLCVVGSICRSRRRRYANEIPGYEYSSELPQYDEFGNRVNVYGPGYVQRPGYEPYRSVASPSPGPNNVTVNVVQGDLSQ